MRIEKIFKRKRKIEDMTQKQEILQEVKDIGMRLTMLFAPTRFCPLFFLSIIVFVCFGLECVCKICNHYKHITISSISSTTF